MALNSVNPNQPTATPVPSEDDNSTGNGIKVPQSAVPGPNPLDQQALATLKTPTVVNTGGGSSGGSSTGSQVLGTVGKIGGTIIGGPIGGAIGGVLGDVLGGLFKQGGYVGLAQGGPTDNMTYGPGQTIEPGPAVPSGDTGAPKQEALNHVMGMGYILGALHQRDFGGTPDTLDQAAEIISKMVGEQKPQGFAYGGEVQQPAGQMMPQQQMPQQPAGQMQAQVMPQPRPMMPQQQRPGGFMQQHHQQPQMGHKGFMPQMAGGGPLQPGQPFVGEGEVKGPGGPTDDAIPAKLSNGEYVMSAPAVAFFGVDKMDKMNMQGKQGFMQSKMQVQANQEGAMPPGEGPPTAQPQQMPSQPPQGMPMPMAQAKGGPAVTRTRGSGFMG